MTTSQIKNPTAKIIEQIIKVFLILFFLLKLMIIMFNGLNNPGN